MDQEFLTQIITKVIEKITTNSIMTHNPKPISIGVSNRHIHLSHSDLEILFGQGYELQNYRDLSQPGQYAATETVIIAGPKGCIEQVRVLGPVRQQTQVEVSRNDAFKLGTNAPIRESGKLQASGGITVIGPKGAIHLKEGLIIAQRHIHMTPEDASAYGVIDSQVVQVKAGGERGLIFDNVVVRVSDKFSLDFHIDIDEANAAGVRHGEKSAYLLPVSVNIENIEATNQNIGKTSICKPMEKIIEKSTESPIERPIEKPTVEPKIVTEEVVREAHKKGALLVVNKGIICTPLARDTIKDLGVQVEWR